VARRLVLFILAVVLSAAILPMSVAAAGPGQFLHGGKPTADVTVQCALTGYDYDVIATINPDLVVEAVTSGEVFALAWQKTSAKASALSVFLDLLDTSFVGLANVVVGEDLSGIGSPFTYVLVQFGYIDPITDAFVVLGSGTGKCKPGDLTFL
jgi:hypothetical protein